MQLNEQLRILRKLDTLGLSEEAIAYFLKHDGSADYVDTDKPRDAVWTEEIMANTLGYVIADDEGNILTDPFGTIVEAEKARSGAKIRFSLVLDEDDKVDDEE